MHVQVIRLQHRREYVLIGLFALGLLPRLAMLAVHRGDLESWEYETLAQSVVTGNGYAISHFGHMVLAFGDGNLYTFLTATVYSLFGHHQLLMAGVQAVTASLLAPVTYAIAERALGLSRAALGAALGALHPGLVAYTLKLHPLGIDALLLSLFLFWTLRSPWSGRGRLMTGLALGLNLMSRPTFFVAGLAALAVRWFGRRRELGQIIAVVVLGVVVAVPWIARNWAFLGQPVLTSTSLEDVWKGNNPYATGSGFLAPGMDVFELAPIDLRDRIWAADELHVGDVFGRETLSFVQQQPREFAVLVARKFAYFWWLPQQAGVLYPAAWLQAYQLYAVVIYAFAALGAITILRGGTADERQLLLTVASVGLTLAIIHALAYVEGRHRWAIEPLVLLLTARGMFVLASAARNLSAAGQSRGFRRVSER